MKRATPPVIALGLALLLLAVLPAAGGAEVPPASSPFQPSALLPIRPSDDITTYTYLPVVMRAYRPPPPPPVYPNDPHYSSQWGLIKVNAPAAWALSKSEGVLIAVLDTGADFSHPDLSGKLRGDIDRDFVNNDDNAQDDHGHGTHVSGTAAAATDNNTGVAGLGWGATVLPLKMMDRYGGGYASDLASAIYYAADRGAKVINMSLGGDASCPDYLQEAIDYAYGRGVLLVAAAGNNGGNRSVFPANCNHVLGVAATTSGDTRASFSNYGSHVSVAAPGVSILSTCLGGGYCSRQGTSTATPFVAGLAALVYARYSAYTPDQVASAILDNAMDLGTSGWDPYYGCGRIDAFQAVWEGARGSAPVCLGTQTWGTAKETAPFVPGEVIVILRAEVNGSPLRHAGTILAEEVLYRTLFGLEVWRLRVPVGREQEILARLRADPSVISADLNYLIYAR